MERMGREGTMKLLTFITLCIVITSRADADLAELTKRAESGDSSAQHKLVRIPINSDTDSKIVGQSSGIFGQLSERSDALA